MVKARQNPNTHNVHQYLVVGRAQPSEKDPNPRIYKMRIFANDVVHAKSKFWYFLKRLNKIKRGGGDILSVNEVIQIIKLLDLRTRPFKSKDIRNCLHLQVKIRISHFIQGIQKYYP